MEDIVELHPTENLALAVARSHVGRGEPVPPNVATMLVLALDRLTGRADWTTEDPAPTGRGPEGSIGDPASLKEPQGSASGLGDQGPRPISTGRNPEEGDHAK